MSTGSFNFASAGGSGASNPFGAASGRSIFGQNATGSTPTPSAISFGQSSTATTTAPTSSIFGGGATVGGGTSIFGNKGSNPGSGTSTPSLFGGNTGTGTAPVGGLTFGTAATSAGQTGSLFSTVKPPTVSFGGSGSEPFSFGQKKDETAPGTSTSVGGSGSGDNTAAAPPPGGLFGGIGSNPGTSPFGKVLSSSTATTATPLGSTTPATNKITFDLGSSTTPAGPPPTEPPKNLFASSAQQSGGGLFSNLAKPAESAQQPATSGGLFGGSTTTSGLFGGAKPTTLSSSSNLFSDIKASKPGSSDTTGSATPTNTLTSTPKPTFSFPQPATTPSTQPSSTLTTAPLKTSNLFSGASKTTLASSAPSQPSSLFGGLSNSNTIAPTTSGPATVPSLFSGVGSNTSTTTPTTSATSATTSTPSTTAPATSSNLFGIKPAASAAGQASSAIASSSTATSNSGTGNIPAPSVPPLGASTAGPAPQLSRLKNKTMDEIITRWASDLSKYQKEFQEQAAQVASWDRLLVENGEKIQKLYLSTFEAERASTEVERQLSSVESQQDELAAWLDRYEADIDEMFARQVGPGETLQGPDQERERTYKLAEKLTDRLDEMGKNLSSMIEAINEASSTLSKSSKSDDPLSHIVRVLNQHLTQLQWIDLNATALQKKVAAAQKVGQNMGSNGLQENDLADDFYRSYMGRR